MPLSDDETLLTLSTDLIAALEALFGQHPGFRPAHARGVMLKGTFTPTPAAAALSSAPHFAAASTPVVVRFSSSTGIPHIPDTDPNADPRGIGVRFDLGARKHTDIIAHSAEGFPVRTGAEFLAFLRAVAASGAPGAAHPTPVEQFVGAHPAALRFVTLPKPPPESFAREAFFGLNAMRFDGGAGGAPRFGRYTILPALGTAHLDAAAAAARGPDFLYEELPARLPATFELWVQLAAPGDVTDDVTVHWPADRERVRLGAFVLDALVPDSDKEQKSIIYDPIPRVQGIEPSDDPLLELRAAIYLISGRRRRAA